MNAMFVRPHAAPHVAAQLQAALAVAAAVVAVVAGPALRCSAQTTDNVLAVTVAAPGSDPAHDGPVLRYAFQGVGPLMDMGDIPPDTTSLQDPIGPVFSSRGELFVGNRHGTVGMGLGSISRFVLDVCGQYTESGVITGNSLESVHGVAFSPTGELFAANFFSGDISRFVFDGSGNPIANGVFASGAIYIIGLAFSPVGELFVTNHSPTVQRFVFDGSGTAVPNGSFTIPDASRLHFLAFGPGGELFLPDIDTDTVFRYTFDNDGVPIANGSINVPGGPIGIAFSPQGELFVSAHFGGGVYRFLFGAQGEVIPNGSIETDLLGGLAIRPLTICPADFNCDGRVDFFDYDELVLCFEEIACPPGTSSDFNHDGSVDFFDYDDFMIAFKAGC